MRYYVPALNYAIHVGSAYFTSTMNHVYIRKSKSKHSLEMHFDSGEWLIFVFRLINNNVLCYDTLLMLHNNKQNRIRKKISEKFFMSTLRALHSLDLLCPVEVLVPWDESETCIETNTHQ